MTALALLFTLSAIGIAETVYLIRMRLAAKSPVCIFGEDCQVVLKSKYNKTFLIPNDILGLIFYCFTCIALGLMVVGSNFTSFEIFKKSIIIMVSMAALISFYFVWLQYKVIRAWCFWCLMSAFTIFLMGIIIITSSFLKG